MKVLCKYWARLARHVSPCVHRAFADFNGWNVVGESGSSLVFLFWFDQLLSITDIGNYPRKRRGGRKKSCYHNIYLICYGIFLYWKKYYGEFFNTVRSDFTVPLTWVYFIQIFKNFSNRICVLINIATSFIPVPY